MKKFAMVFPGQGSQAVGMLSQLAEQYACVIETFNQAKEILGYDLWQLVQEGPVEELNKTWRTQPALLVASVAIYRIWQQVYPNLIPSVMAGHSLGEYSALVCSGALDLYDAIKLVELRGRLMQKAVPEGSGAMYVIIGLDNESIVKACEQSAEGDIVAPVNFNSPGQVVISGQKEAVERASLLCKEMGAKRALPLPVSVPSHCLLMKPAADQLAVALESITLKVPQLDVINNVDVKIIKQSEEIRNSLVRQLYMPVRWSETVSRMANSGVEVLIELGPNKVLTGLTKRINSDLNAHAVNDIVSLEKVIEILKKQEN